MLRLWFLSTKQSSYTQIWLVEDLSFITITSYHLHQESLIFTSLTLCISKNVFAITAATIEVTFAKETSRRADFIFTSVWAKNKSWEKFSKIENFQNGLKKLLILRFCSNEHVIEMRWFCVGFWQKQIFEKFSNPQKFQKNRHFSIFFLLSCLMCIMCHMCTHQAHGHAHPQKS